MGSRGGVALLDRLVDLLRGSPCRLDALIQRVEQRSVQGDPLDQLSVAGELAAHLSEVSDSLLGIFVDRARRAGCSWADVGRALGVSRQAAHERFVTPDLSRYTTRARQAIDLAKEEASGLGHPWVGGEHILLGLARTSDGIAAKALAAMGVTADRVSAKLSESFQGGAPEDTWAASSLTPLAARLLNDLAPTEALALGHNYVGTEHVLLALARQRDALGAKVLRSLDVDLDALREKVLERMASPR